MSDAIGHGLTKTRFNRIVAELYPEQSQEQIARDLGVDQSLVEKAVADQALSAREQTTREKELDPTINTSTDTTPRWWVVE